MTSRKVLSAGAYLTSGSESGILKVTRFLTRLVSERFWGKVTIALEDGRVQVVRVEQTFKPDELK